MRDLKLALLALGCLAASCAAGPEPPVADDSVSARLKAAERPRADRARDRDRKPDQVVEFLGIRPGMTVIDLIAAGGYYTGVLSVAVGPSGKVYAQNPPAVLQLNGGAYDREMTERLAGGALSNVVRVDRNLAEAGIQPESLDAAVTALNFHDIYNGRGPEAAGAFLEQVFALLKPGGVFGLVDHAGDATQDNAQLHRIEEQIAIDAAKAAGFELEAVGDMLRSRRDRRRLSVFDPVVRGKTDRFVLRLRKPS